MSRIAAAALFAASFLLVLPAAQASAAGSTECKGENCNKTNSNNNHQCKRDTPVSALKPKQAANAA